MFERTRILIGDEALSLLQNKRVLVFGLGGVGGSVCETLVRTGIKYIGICDYDIVTTSNKNRQIIALDSTIGKYKTEVMASRLKDINSDTDINIYNFKIDENNLLDIKEEYDYFIDCIDDVSGKIAIITYAYKNNIKIISSMGTGNKLDPSKFRIARINQTKVCPLARVMRYKLKQLNISDLTVLYSEEKPVIDKYEAIPSISFCPNIAGILIARQVILDIINGGGYL